MSVPRASASALLISMSLSTSPLWGLESVRVGDGRSALPGVLRVPMQQFTAPRISAAMDAGYGLTESQKREGLHHRLQGTLGLGFVPMPWLELGLLGAVRHDRHPDDGSGTDSGTIGQFSLVSRVGTRLGSDFRVGADVGSTFPGSEQVADTFSSPALDLRALFGWVPPTGLRLAGYAGYRLDRTSGVGSEASRYRSGDRLALGVSDFNAVLVGAGIVVPIGRTEVLGEASLDWLVGSDVPPLAQSPMRVDLGLRHAITERLWLELLSEYSPSTRPDLSATAALVPIEPRFSASIGLRYRFMSGPSQAPAPPAPPAPPAVKPEKKPDPLPPTGPELAAPPVTSRVAITVVDSTGHPLSDATVLLTTDDGEVALEFETGSTYAAEAVPVGRAHVMVRADLMRDWERDIEISEGQPLDLRVEMLGAEVSGQIRGLVRAFNGKTLPARIHVEPGNHDEIAGSDGSFSIDVSPGKYRVRVSVDGYQPQERTVEIGKNGVMVLNVDLQKDR